MINFMKVMLFILCLCFLALTPSTLNAQSVVVPVSQTPGFKQTASIKSGAGRLHVVYDNTVGELQSVFYQQSVDGGVSYLPPVRVSPPDIVNFTPDVAISPSGAIYVVWSGIFNQGRAILISRSTNGGASFSAPQAISTGRFGQTPKINISQNGIIYVTYFDSNSNGTTSGTYITSLQETAFPIASRPGLISNAGAFSEQTSVLFDSQQNIYIVYGDSNTGISYLVTANSSGRNFSLPMPIATGSPNFATHATAFIDGQDNIYVAANTGPTGGFNIYFTKSTDKGRTFSTPQIIPNSFAGSSPVIAMSRSGLIVSWTELLDPLKIVSVKSTNGGTTFGAKTVLSSNTLNRSFNSAATINRGTAFFCWVSEVGEPGSDTNVFSTAIQ